MRKLYLKVPTPGGKGNFQYVQADISRLRLDLLTELYELDLHQGRYKPVVGAERVLEYGLDVSSLKSTVEELLGLIRESLSGFGNTGHDVSKEIVEELDLRSFIGLLGNAQPEQADEELRRVLYSLLSGICNVARRLHELESHSTKLEAAVDGQDAAIHHLGRTLEETDNITANLLLKWGLAVDGIRRAVQELRAFEERVENFQIRIEERQKEWAGMLEPQNPDLKVPMEFFDGTAESFVLKAFLFLKGQGDKDEMQRLVATAEHYLSHVKILVSLVQESWQKVREEHYKEIFPLHGRLEPICSDLLNAIRQFREHEASFPQGTAKPYEHPKAPITKQEYDLVVALLKDPKWAPMTAQRRIEGKVASLISFLQSPPALPDEVSTTLESVENSIERIKEELGEEKSKVGLKTPSLMPQAASLSPERLSELYELVICVAYVMTCNSNATRASNFRKFLRIVEHLGLCSPDEIPLHRELIDQAEENIESLTDPSCARERWERSPKTWICYPLNYGRRNRRIAFKLTKAMIDTAVPLMEKYRLNGEAVREAYQKVLAEQKAASQNKRAGE